MKGKTISNETKLKISKANKGKKKTIEHKIKLSQAQMGKKPANRVKVIINDIIYDSLKEASTKLHIPLSTLRNRIKSKNIKYLKYKIYESIK